jgi:exo-beta-1,3-glucanase (GH17 family)
MKRVLVLTSLFVVAFNAIVGADDIVVSNIISGVVSDSSSFIDSSNYLPMQKTKVKVVNGNLKDSTMTDSLGRFSLTIPMPPVSVSLVDFESSKISLWQKNDLLNWSGANGPISIEMMSISGRKVISFQVDKPSGTFVIPRLTKGLYLIKFVSSSQTEVFRYLSLSNKGSSLIGKSEVYSNLKGLSKSAAALPTVTFEKLSYQTYTLNLSGIKTGLSIKLQSIPNSKYMLYGLNFSPYMDGQNPNNNVFISRSQMIERMSILKPYTKTIRTFSTTHGFNVVGKIAHQLGFVTYIGAWLGRDTVANNAEFDSLVAMAKRGEVDTAIIGSESMLRRDVTEAKLIDFITRFKTMVPGIPVTTADVYGELTSRPNLIAVCDFVYGNFYPYWEGVEVKYAVANLQAAYLGLQKIAGTKPILISEAGWPSAGATNGMSIPTLENASFYFLNLVSWARAKNVKIFYFEAFDEAWKTAEGTVGPNWGLFDKTGVLKTGMEKVFNGDTIANNWDATTLIDGEGTPTISFTKVPLINTNEKLQGIVSHVIPKDYGVVLYIYVPGAGWWIKPTFASPVTTINVDGTWTCNIVTGGNDASATQIRAILIPAGYAPPSSVSSFPADKIVAEALIRRGVVIDGVGTPTITFTTIPEINTIGKVVGQISHVNPIDCDIVLYTYIPSLDTWVMRPEVSTPKVIINEKGGWECHLGASASDITATKIRGIIIPYNYTPPEVMANLPADKIIAEVTVFRTEVVIPPVVPVTP